MTNRVYTTGDSVAITARITDTAPCRCDTPDEHTKYEIELPRNPGSNCTTRAWICEHHLATPYARGYRTGYLNGDNSSKEVIGVMYIPTAAERARSVDFKGDDEFRRGWLAGWTAAVSPFRDFQKREMGVTTAAQWAERRSARAYHEQP